MIKVDENIVVVDAVFLAHARNGILKVYADDSLVVHIGWITKATEEEAGIRFELGSTLSRQPKSEEWQELPRRIVSVELVNTYTCSRNGDEYAWRDTMHSQPSFSVHLKLDVPADQQTHRKLLRYL